MIVAMFCWENQVQAQFLVNGTASHYDQRTNSFLMSIGENNWGKDYPAVITAVADSCWKNIRINDSVLVNDSTSSSGKYTFCCIHADGSYTITAEKDGQIIESTLSFTSLPILQLQGEFGNGYASAALSLDMPTATESITGMKAQVKWRGGSTNIGDKHKRNYKIKFEDDEGNSKDYRFFGLRKDNTWILDAGQVDLFRMRNRIAADLWNDMATKPYYIDSEPNALTASRGQMVEVFLNKDYQGLYNLCEPIDRKQLKLKKFDEDTGEIHGGLWKSTGCSYASFWFIPTELYDNTLDTWDVFEVKYPEIDDLCPTDYSTLYNAVKFGAENNIKGYENQVADYFDVPVMKDYYIITNVLNAWDICAKNVYWAVYDKVQDKKLTVALWDLDCTVGQNYVDDPLHPDYVAYDSELLAPNRVIAMLALENIGGFMDATQQRYKELRNGILSTSQLVERYTQAYRLVHECGADKREENRWSQDTDVSGVTLDFAQELSYITDWIEHRMKYLDAKWLSVTGIDKNLVSSSSDSENSVFENIDFRNDNFGNWYNLSGMKVSGDYRGMMIKKGKKVVR